MYIYRIEYEELDWERCPLHDIGCFSTRRGAFKIFKNLIVNKYKKLEIENDGIIFWTIKIHKGKNRVYVDIDDEDGWIEN